jgi:hypothetical protein
MSMYINVIKFKKTAPWRPFMKEEAYFTTSNAIRFLLSPLNKIWAVFAS